MKWWYWNMCKSQTPADKFMDWGSSLVPRYSDLVAPSAHFGAPTKANTLSNYQPHYKPKGPDIQQQDLCNFCGIDRQFERECELKSMPDCMKDYKNHVLELHNQNSKWPRTQFRRTVWGFRSNENDPGNFELASEVVDACFVELKMIASSQQTNSWYLDSRATHHVCSDPSILKSIHLATGACVCSPGGHNHEVTGVGNVDISISSRAITSATFVLYTLGIINNSLRVGFLADRPKLLSLRQHDVSWLTIMHLI